MKKALQISLARTLFTVEEDAYARLDGYLTSVRAALAGDAGRDEIIADVEGRIAEKFIESGKPIITMDEVSAVIAAMGEASAYLDEGAAPAPAAAPAAGSSSDGKAQPKKKLYRDMRNAIVGGVCSGLGTYFNVDAVWIRLLFVVLAFGNGIGILIYVVLWMIVPEAKTGAQRLEMEGVPVNLATIAENARETVGEFSDKHGGRVREMVDTGTSAFGRAVSALLRAAVAVLRIGVGLFLIFMTVPAVLFLSVAVPFILANPGAPYFAFPLTDAVAAPVLWAGALSGYLLVVLPCVLFFLVAIGLLRRKPVLNVRLTVAFCLIWIAALATGVASLARGLSTGEAYVRSSPLFEVTSRPVTVGGPLRELEVLNGVRVTLQQGDVPAMEMSGRTNELDAMRVTEKEGLLTISREDLSDGWCIFCSYRGVEVTLTVPDVETVNVSGGSRLRLEKWVAAKPLAMKAANGSRIYADGTFADMQLTAGGGSRMELSGKGGNAVIEAENGSSVEAESLDVQEMTVTARGGSSVSAGTTVKLVISASGGSRVTYLGSPEVTKTVNGGASVRGVDQPEERAEGDGPDASMSEPESPESPEAPGESPESPEAPEPNQP